MDELIGSIIGFLLIGDILKSKAGATILLLVLAITIPSCIGYLIWNKPVAETLSMIDAQSKIACSSADSKLSNVDDYWGVEINTDISEDGNGSFFCQSTSAGRDNVFNTDDDLVAKQQNINKSRIAELETSASIFIETVNTAKMLHLPADVWNVFSELEELIEARSD